MKVRVEKRETKIQNRKTQTIKGAKKYIVKQGNKVIEKYDKREIKITGDLWKCGVRNEKEKGKVDTEEVNGREEKSEI